MDHHTAHDLLAKMPLTWGQLRDHVTDRFFGDDLPGMSTVNPSVPIGQVWQVYDAAMAKYDPDQAIDTQSARDDLLACNIVRDFGLPMPEATP